MADLCGVSLDWLAGRAPEKSGLRCGRTVVDTEAVKRIKTVATRGGTLQDLKDLLAQPALLYAWEIPSQPELLEKHKARELHRDMDTLIAKLRQSDEP